MAMKRLRNHEGWNENSIGKGLDKPGRESIDTAFIRAHKVRSFQGGWMEFKDRQTRGNERPI